MRDALQQAFEYSNRLRDEAEWQVHLVSQEAQQHLAQASKTITVLRPRNQELEEQHKEMIQKLAIIQADMQSLKAQHQAQVDASHIHAAKMSQPAGHKTIMARTSAKPSQHSRLV